MTEEQALNYKVDRTTWPSGPWDNEPDRKDFEHAGFACLLLRNQLGSWCGYVGVGPDHPLANVGSYDDPDVSVHGGLTFTGKCKPPICHVPRPGMPEDVTWFGFDCAHSGDLVPGIAHYGLGYLSHGHYRDMAYAESETRGLADQLAAMKP